MAGKVNTTTAIAIAVIAAVLVGSFVVVGMMLGGGSDGELVAMVHDSDGNVYEMPLDTDDTLEVTTDLGTNVVVVQDGEVYMDDADCDGHDCMRQGSISVPSRQIICLPHKLWIEVVRSGESGGSMDVEAVAGSDSEADEDLDVVAR